jgi:hypothetical protein
MASYSVMIFGLHFRFPNLAFLWLSVLGLYVLCITSALALGSLQSVLKLATSDNRGLRLGAGFAEGGETGLAYTAFLLFPQWINTLVYVWLFILITTIALRSMLAYRTLRVSKIL